MAIGLQPNQNQPEVTVNAMSFGLFPIDCSAATLGSPAVVSEADAHNHIIKCTGTPSGAFGLQLPNDPKTYVIWNDTSQTVTVARAGGGASLNVTAGQKMYMFSDGTDLIQAAPAVT